MCIIHEEYLEILALVDNCFFLSQALLQFPLHEASTNHTRAAALMRNVVNSDYLQCLNLCSLLLLQILALNKAIYSHRKSAISYLSSSRSVHSLASFPGHSPPPPRGSGAWERGYA